MSVFSGRCDLYDTLIIIGEVEDFSKVHIFINDNPIELRIDSQKDLIPYYACISSISAYDNGEYFIRISGEPCFLEEESDYRKDILYEEMVKNGYDKNTAYKRCYGWKRFVEKLKSEGE
jgi:hypothetical protein